jgi:hypothetical protein
MEPDGADELDETGVLDTVGGVGSEDVGVSGGTSQAIMTASISSTR